MANAADIEKIAVQLEAKLKQDSPEDIITGLAHLVLAKDTMQPPLYNALVRQMAGWLYLKTLRQK